MFCNIALCSEQTDENMLCSLQRSTGWRSPLTPLCLWLRSDVCPTTRTRSELSSTSTVSRTGNKVEVSHPASQISSFPPGSGDKHFQPITAGSVWPRNYFSASFINHKKNPAGVSSCSQNIMWRKFIQIQIWFVTDSVERESKTSSSSSLIL